MPSRFCFIRILTWLALLTILIVSRLDCIRLDSEISADESVIGLQAKRLAINVTPWLESDAGTIGPITTLAVSVIPRVGVLLDYRALHLAAIIILAATLLVLAEISRRLLPPSLELIPPIAGTIAVAGAFTNPFTQFASELVPNLLVTVAVWQAQNRNPPRRWMLPLAVALLGATPFAKLQFVPIAGLLLIALIGRSVSGLRGMARWRAALVMCASFAAPGALLLAWVAWRGG